MRKSGRQSVFVSIVNIYAQTWCLSRELLIYFAIFNIRANVNIMSPKKIFFSTT